MGRSETVHRASAGDASRALLALQCVSACAGTTLGATLGSGTIGKLIESAGGALITAFLTAPGRHHPRRIMAVGLVLALLHEGKALAATARHPRARPSMLPRPAGLLVTAAVAVIGFSAGWVVLASPFVASPTSGESAVNVAMPVPKPHVAPVHVRSSKHATVTRPTSTTPPPTAVNVPQSSGPTLVLVPTVAGQTLSAAQTSLHGAGFMTSTSTQPSPTVARGMVMSSDPTGGSRVLKGSKVQIVVSSGPVQVTLPDVTGLPVKSALGVLQSKGFAPTVSLQPNPTVAPGDVIDTTPAAGTLAAPGSAVAVLVSASLTSAAGPG